EVHGPAGRPDPDVRGSAGGFVADVLHLGAGGGSGELPVASGAGGGDVQPGDPGDGGAGDDGGQDAVGASPAKRHRPFRGGPSPWPSPTALPPTGRGKRLEGLSPLSPGWGECGGREGPGE